MESDVISPEVVLLQCPVLDGGWDNVQVLFGMKWT